MLSAWKVDGLATVPEHAKPSRDATLWAHLMPPLSYRLIGDGLERGTVPASIVASAVKRPTAAIKRLLEIAFKRRAQGRPDEQLRTQYDLIAKRMAFNSFEVSFQPRAEAQQLLLEDGTEAYAQSAQALSEAFAWLRGSNEDADIDVELLEVLRELAPPIHGQVTETEIKGRLVRTSPIRLSREHTKRVRRAIATRGDSRDAVLLVGKIRELDRDRFTFILRELADGSKDTVCAFEEELFDAVFDAFDTEFLVNVLGRFGPKSNTLEVVVVEPKTDDEPRRISIHDT